MKPSELLNSMKLFDSIIDWARSLPEPWPGIILILALTIAWAIVIIPIMYWYTKDDYKSKIPQDEYGFMKGTLRVTIEWKDE